MTDKKSAGDINVTMGDNNNVDHIGHNITFQAPPPDPNSIFLNGEIVGALGSAPRTIDESRVQFEKLFFNRPVGSNVELECQGGRFLIESWGVDTRASIGGRPPQITYWNAVCRFVK